MSFLAPWRLLLLLVPLALVAGYVAAQRSRRRAALRFTSVDLLASVAPRHSAWQRHVPAATLLLATTALVLAVAQPATATLVARQRATVMLVLDTSGSMRASDVAPSRLQAAVAEARAFVAGLPQGLQLGLVSFDSVARVQAPPTSDRSTVLAALATLRAGTATDTQGGIQLALDAIRAVPPAAGGKPAPAVIVLMSDGTPTVSDNGLPPLTAAEDAAAKARQAHVPIDTIAFGTDQGVVQVNGQTVPVPYDPASMAAIASASGGRTFRASSAGELRSVYDQIGRAVGYEVHRHEVTVWFAAGALALLVAAAAAGLWWTQRVI